MATEQVNAYASENVPSSGSWFKFENVGDAVKGTLAEVPKIQEGVGSYRDQEVYKLVKAKIETVEVDHSGEYPKVKSVLTSEDAEMINVGISVDRKFIIDRLENAKVGDIIAFAFLKEIPPTTKGYKPTKSITPYIVGKDEEFLKQRAAASYQSAPSSEEIFVEDLPF